ncbi:hypothetical protein [Breoghania sp.]|uniref:hypothetical protein n=1 Tax=Breoghania sp. TaxID=2065378 RepID=UPI002616CBC4|nr:hypothetical protein [Breoghania sp.]MDJ0930129.1 hypothetical protein [Breoghania sp.]
MTAAVEGPVGAFLSQVFPNKVMRQVVFDHVAATTGIRQDALDALMPVAATLMMGQMARNFAVGPARDLLDAFMAGFARGRSRPTPTPADLMAPFAEAISAFLTGFMRAGSTSTFETAPTPERRCPPEHENEGVYEDMEEEGEPEPETAQGAADPEPSGSALASTCFLEDFLAAGRSVRESQIRAFEQLFETLTPADHSK